MAAALDQDVKAEYESRLAEWSRRAEAHERAHRRMGNWRFLFAVAVVALTVVLAQTRIGVGASFAILIAGIFLTGLLHDRILRARDSAKRAMGFYQAGLDRLDGTWAQNSAAGDHGAEFLDPHHPFASDLDLFGPGSLFALLNTAQTQSGRETLAAWLLAPAASDEIRARQQAVDELRTNLDLRERLGLIAAEAQGWIRTATLIAWAAQPRLLQSNFLRVAAFCLPPIGAALFFSGELALFAVTLAAQSMLAASVRRPVQRVVNEAGVAPRDLQRLAEVLRCLEARQFKCDRLRRSEEEGRSEGESASQAIARLGRLYSWMESGNNLVFIAICKFFLWDTQFAFAIEAWRARFGPKVRIWLGRLAEFEALSSLAGYAYEHPSDPFPELLPVAAPTRVEAEGLGHPLIPDSRSVRNNVSLDTDRRLIMIRGSNMSGKSTYLRAIGVNLVLASAGAPVRAQKFRMTPVRLGASIRTADSLQEGISRFYAEIKRLADIVQLAGQGAPLVFLLDEILSGTNSHDRRIGAARVALSLVQRGALGLMTTHDLALTRIVEEITPPGENFHFEDQLLDGKMSFDYRLRPGIVQKSNALELMRSVGLDVMAPPYCEQK